MPADQYVRPVVSSSKITFGLAWIAFLVAVFLSWRRALALPFGQSDPTWLAVTTLAGALGLALTGDHVRRKDSGG